VPPGPVHSGPGLSRHSAGARTLTGSGACATACPPRCQRGLAAAGRAMPAHPGVGMVFWETFPCACLPLLVLCVLLLMIPIMIYLYIVRFHNLRPRARPVTRGGLGCRPDPRGARARGVADSKWDSVDRAPRRDALESRSRPVRCRASVGT
jgi:hypothetical protein